MEEVLRDRVIVSVALVMLALTLLGCFGSLYLMDSSERQAQIAHECIASGGDWLGNRCEHRPK